MLLVAAGCGGSSTKDVVPKATGPADPKIQRVDRGEGGAEAAASRKPESTPLSVD
jgi:hypothetical protein